MVRERMVRFEELLPVFLHERCCSTEVFSSIHLRIHVAQTSRRCFPLHFRLPGIPDQKLSASTSTLRSTCQAGWDCAGEKRIHQQRSTQKHLRALVPDLQIGFFPTVPTRDHNLLCNIVRWHPNSRKHSFAILRWRQNSAPARRSPLGHAQQLKTGIYRSGQMAQIAGPRQCFSPHPSVNENPAVRIFQRQLSNSKRDCVV